MKKWIIILLAMSMLAFVPHKFYVSNTIIEFRPTTQSYQITCKIFTDDLERVLGGEALHLGGEKEASNANALIETYLSNHLKIHFNDEPQLLMFIGKEVENDLTLCYLEMNKANDFNVLKVENTILQELFPEQKNIVEVRVGGKSQTYILTKEKSAETIFH
jgi:hypothetical protein